MNSIHHETLALSRRFLFAIACCLAIVAQGGNQATLAQVASDVPAVEVTVEQGLQGVWKVGYETPLRIRSASKDAEKWTAELVTVDGDGIPVSQRSDFKSDSSGGYIATIIARHGRANRSMQLQILSDGKSIFRRELKPQERGTVLPLNQPWLIGIGTNLQLEEVSVPSIRGGFPSISLSTLSDPSTLPDNRHVYEAARLIVLGTDNQDFLKGISAAQGQALADWVESGGRLQIWLGKNAELVQGLDWLNKLIAGKIIGVSKNVDPALLESFVASNQTTRLSNLTCATFDPKDLHYSKIEFSLMSADRTSLPFIIHSAYGSGVVDVIATDINSDAILAWKDRTHILERLFKVQEMQQEKETQSQGATQYVGYDDMAGQIRASLDMFDTVHSGTISLMAVLAFLFLALIGPVDYYFFNKSLRRSAWTWLTLCITCIGLVALTQILTASWKPKGIVANSMEIVDFHFDTGRVFGNSFVHQYSKTPNRFHLSAQATSLDGTSVASSASNTPSTTPTYLRWSGKPGSGLGGFESDVRIDVGMPGYEINRLSAENDFTEINGVGIPTAGTYAARASWTQSCGDMVANHQLTNHLGSDLLEGSFKNPLSQDLIKPVIYYESWAYPVKDRVKSGETVSLSIANSPRDLSRQLQQKLKVGDREQVVPWDRGARRNAPRLLELLSMYDASGGKRYLGLELGYLRQFDLSLQLGLNRAVLIAQVEQPVLKWQASSSDKIEVCHDGYRTTVVRFLLPIQDR